MGCGLLWLTLYFLNPVQFHEAFRFSLAYENPIFYKRTLIVLLGLLLSLAVELLHVGWKKSAIYKIFYGSKSARRDQVICLLFIFGIFDFIGHLLTLGLPYFFSYKLNQAFPILRQLQFVQKIDSLWLRILLGFILQDLFLYLAHRFMHKFDWLWQLHKYHHTSTEMTIFAAHRNDPFARPIRSIVSSIPIVFFGVDFASFLWILLVADFIAFITHSEVDQDWGWLGRNIFTSPRAHKIHHSTNPAHHNKNFGFSFILWDRIFGTYLPPSTEVKDIGASDPLHNKGNFAEEMFSSVQRILYSLRETTKK